MSKNIGILGSGAVAKALGNGFIKYGYSVMLGTSNAGKLADWQTQSGGQVGTFEEAAQFGEIIILAVKGHAAESVVKSLTDKLAGKTVVDTANPIDDTKPPVNGVLNYFTGPNQSLMESLQAAAPQVNFVKAFNSIGAHLMVNPQQFDATPTMFICGNNDAAKQEVSAILTLFGFEAEDMGKAEAARPIEALCALWCIPGFAKNQWVHAFRLMRPKTA